ncbi:MAG: hypothetical protein HQL20_07995 [Candidatus Omnitrophica bacterium]|nr:hypothetical protein [Candidatus Omnitrophota bacterium]
MKVSDFLKVMFLITTMGVLYIHLQMNIYDLAYQGKRREDKIEKLAENNNIMKNEILRLKSSDHMGRQLLAKENDYKFLGRNNVVEVEETAGNPLAGLLALAKF